METAIYSERKTFSRYDALHIICYLNEQVIEDYTPDGLHEGEEEYQPRTAYSYTGTMTDGGTLIEAAADDRHQWHHSFSVFTEHRGCH